MALYRGMDRAALDTAYNNGAAVKNSAQIVADWQARSDAFRKRHSKSLDLKYGDAPRNRIDYYDAHAGGPLFVFIHGGYWQMRAKDLVAFLAAGPMAHGINVALIGYTLAPDKRLDGIVREIEAALDFLEKKSSGMCLSGWSAGGHLTAMSLAHPAVSAGLAISGIYDLEPIRLSYLNEKLRLAQADVAPLSPLRNIPGASPPLVVTYGTGELPELQRQSREYADARANAGLPGKLAPLAGHNHFSILEELASPEGAMTRILLELVGAS